MSKVNTKNSITGRPAAIDTGPLAAFLHGPGHFDAVARSGLAACQLRFQRPQLRQQRLGQRSRPGGPARTSPCTVMAYVRASRHSTPGSQASCGWAICVSGMDWPLSRGHIGLPTVSRSASRSSPRLAQHDVDQLVALADTARSWCPDHIVCVAWAIDWLLTPKARALS